MDKLGPSMTSVAAVDSSFHEGMHEVESMGLESIGFPDILEVGPIINVLQERLPYSIPAYWTTYTCD